MPSSTRRDFKPQPSRLQEVTCAAEDDEISYSRHDAPAPYDREAEIISNDRIDENRYGTSIAEVHNQDLSTQQNHVFSTTLSLDDIVEKDEVQEEVTVSEDLSEFDSQSGLATTIEEVEHNLSGPDLIPTAEQTVVEFSNAKHGVDNQSNSSQSMASDELDPITPASAVFMQEDLVFSDDSIVELAQSSRVDDFVTASPEQPERAERPGAPTSNRALMRYMYEDTSLSPVKMRRQGEELTKNTDIEMSPERPAAPTPRKASMEYSEDNEVVPPPVEHQCDELLSIEGNLHSNMYKSILARFLYDSAMEEHSSLQHADQYIEQVNDSGMNIRKSTENDDAELELAMVPSTKELLGGSGVQDDRIHKNCVNNDGHNNSYGFSEKVASTQANLFLADENTTVDLSQWAELEISLPESEVFHYSENFEDSRPLYDIGEKSCDSAEENHGTSNRELNKMDDIDWGLISEFNWLQRAVELPASDFSSLVEELSVNFGVEAASKAVDTDKILAEEEDEVIYLLNIKGVLRTCVSMIQDIWKGRWGHGLTSW
jgi:hypothetical protein